MNIGERIKHIRKESGVTQKQLAEKLGMTQAAIVQFESEKSNPKIDTLKKIANALNVSVTDFLDDGESITAILPILASTKTFTIPRYSNLLHLQHILTGINSQTKNLKRLNNSLSL